MPWRVRGTLVSWANGRRVLLASSAARHRPAAPPCAPTRPARGLSGLWTRQLFVGFHWIQKIVTPHVEFKTRTYHRQNSPGWPEAVQRGWGGYRQHWTPTTRCAKNTTDFLPEHCFGNTEKEVQCKPMEEHDNQFTCRFSATHKQDDSRFSSSPADQYTVSFVFLYIHTLFIATMCRLWHGGRAGFGVGRTASRLEGLFCLSLETTKASALVPRMFVLSTTMDNPYVMKRINNGFYNSNVFAKTHNHWLFGCCPEADARFNLKTCVINN